MSSYGISNLSRIWKSWRFDIFLNRKSGKLKALKRINLGHSNQGVPSTALREIGLLKELEHPIAVDDAVLGLTRQEKDNMPELHKLHNEKLETKITILSKVSSKSFIHPSSSPKLLSSMLIKALHSSTKSSRILPIGRSSYSSPTAGSDFLSRLAK